MFNSLMISFLVLASFISFAKADAPVVPSNAGWGTPSADPIWLGNPGDYPGKGPGHEGHFLTEQTHCDAGTIPLVVGTTDKIMGGNPAQIRLDGARASAVAPPDWDGDYATYLGTPIQGTDAAAIYCVPPGTIVAPAAALLGSEQVGTPPPQGDLVVEALSGPVNLKVGEEATFTAKVRNAGNADVTASHLQFTVDGERLGDEVAVPALKAGEFAEVTSATYKGTSAGLHTPHATADSEEELAEANEWNNARDGALSVAAPAETPGSTEPIPPVMRKGGYLALQNNWTRPEVKNYHHLVVGGFVTFNLGQSERVGAEPYLGVGTDFMSDHCGNTKWAPNCSGWFLSMEIGIRTPITVMKKDGIRVMVFPDLSLLSDDVNVGFHSWGQFASGQLGGEVWFTGRVPVAIALELGVTRLAWMDSTFEHQNGWGFPLRLEVKVPIE